MILILDIEFFIIIGCSKIVYVYVDWNIMFGFIMWNEFIVIDNYDSSVEVVKEGNIFFGDKIFVGSYKFIYRVVDFVGNKV